MREKKHNSFDEKLNDFFKEEIRDNLQEVNHWIQDATKGKVLLIKLDLDDKDWEILKELAKIEDKSVQQLTNEAVKSYIKKKSPV